MILSGIIISGRDHGGGACRGKDRRGGGAVPKEWSGSGTPDSLFFGWFGF